MDNKEWLRYLSDIYLRKQNIKCYKNLWRKQSVYKFINVAIFLMILKNTEVEEIESKESKSKKNGKCIIRYENKIIQKFYI